MAIPDTLVTTARRAVSLATGPDGDFQHLAPLADEWLSTQAGVAKSIAAGDTKLRADLEELFRNYFLQGVLVGVRAFRNIR